MNTPFVLRIAVTDPQEVIHYSSVRYDTERDARAAQRAVGKMAQLLEQFGAWAVSDVVPAGNGARTH